MPEATGLDKYVVDPFVKLFGAVTDYNESKKEAVTANNPGASPDAYSQARLGVTATQEPITPQSGVLDWLQNNWLLLVEILVVLFVVVALIKWVI